MFRGIYHGKRVHADDFVQVLQRAKGSNVVGMMITGGTLEESKEALELAKSDPSLFSTVGCHPTRCKEFLADPEAYYNQLLQVAQEGMEAGKVLAVGESTGLPLFLHNRASTDDFVALMMQHRGTYTKGVVHSFTGSSEELENLLSVGEGIYIGINGCSLKTEENLEVLKRIPLEKLLLETATPPTIPVQPSGGQASKAKPKPGPKVEGSFERRPKERFEMGKMVKGRNEPCGMIDVLRVVSRVRGVSEQDLALQVARNTAELFPALRALLDSASE
ncbi:TatD DNase [Gonapodya sp. JEL0774]|nr:TatD DNase [Gonapodya sp. JEL0774]